jgi:AcrR family transcriptional regulator
VAENGGVIAPGLRERKKQRTRAMLIDAAIELCLKQGFEKTTVDQIASIADVSPRTFSRYFATKDAVITAIVDDAIEKAAVELARQPTDISHLEAILRAYVAMYTNTKSAPATGLTTERVMSTIRMVMTSPTLRQTVSEFRSHAANIALANRMGVGVDDRRLKLVAALWAAIIMTALDDLADPDTDWESLGVDDIVSRAEATYAEFMEVTAGLGQPV